MKSIMPSSLLIVFCLFLSVLYGQEQIKASVGIHNATIAPGGGGIGGLQLGVGTEIPLKAPFYFAPSLWLTQGGQVDRIDSIRFGIRNTYVQLSTAVGYEYALDSDASLKLEVGPTLNRWTRGVRFDNFFGEPMRNRLDIGDTEGANRFFVSGSFDLRYERKVGDLELSAGVRADVGLTAIESFEDGAGEKQRFRTRSLGVVAGVNYDLEGVLGGYEIDTTVKWEVDPEDLIVTTPYDDAVGSFKKARKLVDSAYSGVDSTTLPPSVAQDALDELEKTKKLLEDGIKAWDNGDSEGIGPEAAKLLREYIQTLVEKAQVMADSTWVVEVPEEETGDDPTDTPPPTIYGEEIAPPWITVEGAMQPSQAVWQDDEYFEDKPTKQIVQKDPNRWHAELDMVANRWTGVFGMKYSHKTIYMSGKTTYTTAVPVKFRLKLIQGGSERIIWTQKESKFSIPIEGGTGPERSWSTHLHGGDDAPVPKTFKMTSGEYRLELELIKVDGQETGLKLITYGKAVTTTMPKVHIVPVLLTDEWTPAEGRELADHAKRISEACKSEFYSYFPVPEGGVDMRGEALQFLGSQELGTVDYLVSLMPLTSTQEEVRKDRLIAGLTQRFATTAQLGGAGRVVVVINDADFARIYRNHVGVGGFAPHPKVQILRMRYYATTVAHELIHSFPYLWSVDQMESSCGLNYHNSADGDYGNGVEVYSYGSFYRDKRNSIMGSVSPFAFITQCTYWHLTQQFQQPNDPELYLVRGFLAQQEGQYYGAMSPTYEMEGDAGLAQGIIRPDGWGIVLRDANNNMLASYPFEVVWQDPEEAEPRVLVPFNHRIDRLPGTASIELIGPGGMKATQEVSANAPELDILMPVDGSVVRGGKEGIAIQWKASDQDQDKLQYWVQYSLDEGKNWIPLGDEIQENTVSLPPFQRPKRIKVKVYATDGVRSDMKEVAFGLVP
ncbi:MAG: hypothetical protein AAFU33_02625 [Bacteroidota bacterium]